VEEILNLLQDYRAAVRITRAAEVDVSSCGTSRDFDKLREAEDAERVARRVLVRAIRANRV
jgi:hypothetical protein